ncbi:MAG TPA: enoyl-CoA hydratase-related protein [Nevskia sp.]|nr:enoyl-CoA hydratase-related protein [Nevskia sp.]
MDLTNYECLLLERDGKVLNVTFNRPEAMNAFNPAMEAELRRLLLDVAHDDATHVMVLTGAGKAFSAGGDLNQIRKVMEQPELFFKSIGEAKQLVFAILDCPKPIIAKVNGHAIGLGATLALFSDISFAANHARIADPHVQVGFVAGDGAAVIWPQLVGYNKAKEYLLTGDAILAPDAEKMGLINHAVPAEELDARVHEFAQRLANGASRSVQWTKASINIGLKQLAHSIMDASIAYEALSNITRDHREAVAAMLEKRKPSFTGE